MDDIEERRQALTEEDISALVNLRKMQAARASAVEQVMFFNGFSDIGVRRLAVSSRQAYEARKRERFGVEDDDPRNCYPGSSSRG